MADIDPDANYPVTHPAVVELLGCANARQARDLTYRKDDRRLPSFHMFGRLMIGGADALAYARRVRGTHESVEHEDVVA